MIRKIRILNNAQIAQLMKIAASANYVDGKISNPHSKVKNNQQLHDPQAYQQTSKLLFDALVANPEFHEFAFPQRVAPPLMTKYGVGQNYGLHPDSATINLPDGPLRSDLSCTIFLNEPDRYEGGALHIRLGDDDLRFRLDAGRAVIYPSNTLHEVEPVTSGERHVAITFIQSKIADNAKRDLLFDLNEVAALEGNNMTAENFSRLQLVQYNLMRMWGA
ncbi:Fe2+-dependent dioxygenase [Sphingorhabdus arenilitoris]|uniref:Fe2+-dependent dioxygenase n=1 Tax=Sphingorhabdus arenilitoris TaxID=1490041 RepID=A0ABV8RHE2_9SPHN